MSDSANAANLVDFSAKRLGTALKDHREAAHVSLPEIALRLDHAFTPVVLGMIESGRYPLEEPQIQRLLWGYGATAEDLMPSRNQLEFDETGEHMAVGWTVRELQTGWTAAGLLNEYLAFVYEMRGAAPGSAIPLREDDLAVLSNTIDWPTADIRDYLIDLMYTWRNAAPLDTESQVPGRAAAVRSGGAESSLLGRLRSAQAHPANGRVSVRDTCEVGTVDC